MSDSLYDFGWAASASSNSELGSSTLPRGPELEMANVENSPTLAYFNFSPDDGPFVEFNFSPSPSDLVPVVSDPVSLITHSLYPLLPTIDSHAMFPRLAACRSLPEKRVRNAGPHTPSIFRPDVPADRRVLLWTTPHTSIAQTHLDEELPPSLQTKYFESQLAAHTDQTRQSYGAGLLRFTQFCDEWQIPESRRMPASAELLATFIASVSGLVSGSSVRTYIEGLRLWHHFNSAEWHGGSLSVKYAKKAATKAGIVHSRSPRGPITSDHLQALLNGLDISLPRDAAIWAAACAAFWGCRRLGEILPTSQRDFSPVRHVIKNTSYSTASTLEGRATIAFRFPWSKTTGVKGGQCILTATNDSLCPVSAFANHIKVNKSLPMDAPLFAYSNGSSFRFLLKNDFMTSCNSIFISAGLEHTHGHSFRIGGTLRYLMDGVPPESVAKLGGWTSLCFLLYWRRLQLIIPQDIAKAWSSKITSFASRNELSNEVANN